MHFKNILEKTIVQIQTGVCIFFENPFSTAGGEKFPPKDVFLDSAQ